jgi:SusD family.
MKKIYLLAALFIAVISGCSDFLDADFKSDVPGADYYNTEAGFESLINAVYSSLRPIYNDEPWLMEGGTDLFASGRTSVNVACLYGAAYTSANDSVAGYYRNHYKGISLANEAVYWGGDNATRESRVAEARGLRALLYLNLAQQFSGVPLVKERISGILTEASRSSAQEVYNFVIDELKDITTSSLVATDNTGRFNKAAANHYLAKAYLCRGYLTGSNSDFEAAVSAAKAAGAGNALTTPFATLFSNAGEGNSELLFFLEYSVPTVKDNTSGNKQQANFGAYLNNQADGHKYTTSTLTPTLWMHELFNTDTNNPNADERYDATFMTELRQSYWDFYDEDKKDESAVKYYYCPSWRIGDVDSWRAALPSRAGAQVIEMLPVGKNYAGDETTYYEKMREDVFGVASFRKFDDVGNGRTIFHTNSSMRDIYLARLAETNLIAAEACVKLNQPGEAVRYVNIVRTRAKATQVTQAEMSIDYILNERARELAGENHRWADLARTGKLAEYVEKHNPDISTGQITKKFYLRPIPLAAIELNPALEGNQNEGW